MDTIFEALREDHDRQRELIDKLVQTSGDTDERRLLYQQLKMELAAHADMEERYFYRPLMGADLTQEKARHSVAEHKELDDFVEELDEADMSGSQWLPTAEKLRHRLLHHLEEEEREVFQQAGKILSDNDKVSLADDYQTGMADRRVS